MTNYCNLTGRYYTPMGKSNYSLSQRSYSLGVGSGKWFVPTYGTQRTETTRETLEKLPDSDYAASTSAPEEPQHLMWSIVEGDCSREAPLGTLLPSRHLEKLPHAVSAATWIGPGKPAGSWAILAVGICTACGAHIHYRWEAEDLGFQFEVNASGGLGWIASKKKVCSACHTCTMEAHGWCGPSEKGLGDTLYVSIFVSAATHGARLHSTRIQIVALVCVDDLRSDMYLGRPVFGQESVTRQSDAELDKQSRVVICDVCNAQIPWAERYNTHLLTTRQVVSSPKYWEWRLRLAIAMAESMTWFGRLSKRQIQELKAREAVSGAASSSPWVVCGKCIELFSVDEASSREYAVRWFESAGDFVPPGSGAVDIADVNMGGFGGRYVLEMGAAGGRPKR